MSSSDIDIQYMNNNKIISTIIFSISIYIIISFQYEQDNEINKIVIICLIIIAYYFINTYYPSYVIKIK
jgi:hypothetical protein